MKWPTVSFHQRRTEVCSVDKDKDKGCALFAHIYMCKTLFLFSIHKRRRELTRHNHAEEAADHLVKFLQTSQCNTAQFYILWFMLCFSPNTKLVACMMTLFIVLQSFQSLEDSFPVSQQLICSSVCVKRECLCSSFSTVKMLFKTQIRQVKYLQVKLRESGKSICG